MGVRKVFQTAGLLATVLFSTFVSSLFFRPAVSPSPRALLERLHLRETRYATALRQTVLIRTESGQGSGVLIRRTDSFGAPHWFVWTAAHVVDDTESPHVVVLIKNDYQRVGETVFTGRVIARSFPIDVALLWVDMPDGYGVSAEFDSVVPLAAGDEVFHIGNFLGIELFGSASVGIVSAVGLTPSGEWPWPIADQTTLTIMPGSSGGPLFNGLNNKVAGLTVGLVSERGSAVAIYLPARAIRLVAVAEGVEWAFADSQCPSKAILAQLAEAHVMQHVKLLPGIILHFPLDKFDQPSH